MAAPKLDHHSHALVFGEESLLGNVRFTPDLDIQGRIGKAVAHPFGVQT